MGILDEDVARVREATDLVALASEHLALKRVGRSFVGLCPFHAEKTPSFSINPETGRILLPRRRDAGHHLGRCQADSRAGRKRRIES